MTMASMTPLLAIGLLAAASAAPSWITDLTTCAHDCPISGSPKLAYMPEKTYSYLYTGKSEIHMKDVEGGVSQMEWKSQVDLTWLNPCDMAISFRNPMFGDATASPEATFLTRYPLVVAMNDGRVQHVCSHPDDDTWSINLKKGIASALQNSLPSNSSINSGLNFTETDVVGRCRTLYEVENQGESIIVEKKKNHRFCQERFPTQAETPMSWIKAPFPIQESWSKCKQEITKGIYTSITCEDVNMIKPIVGSYKYIEGRQMSKLEFQSASSNAPQSISNIRGQMVQKSLHHDHATLKKEPAMIPQAEQILKQVCEKTKHGVEKEVASLVNKFIHLMRHIPEGAFEELLEQIKSGQICSEKLKMESIFLDTLGFVQEASAVKLMVKEIMSGRASRGRVALYTASLYFTPRPSIRSVEAVKPLFEDTLHFPMASLAAATMVHTFCKHNPHCEQEHTVRQAAEILGRNIQQQCTPSAGGETEKACYASLKSLGNMGVMTQEVARTVIQCIEMEDAENNICVTAAQTFRNADCKPEPTKHLVSIAVDPKKDTEVRIASYLAAVKCVEEDDLRKISDKLAIEENTQVRGFILSHLLNLQQSSTPHKENLRYMLSSISIPTNFTADMRKYSRNIDISYYVHSLGFGAGVESNILYAPRYFLPRSINFNLTSALGATPVNLGELGARLEGLEPILEKVFGPEGQFRKSSWNEIFKYLSDKLQITAAEIVKHFKTNIRERRSISLSTISQFIRQLYGEKFDDPRADLFARFNGQEVVYGSLTKDILNDISFKRMIVSCFKYISDVTQEMAREDIDVARTFQLAFDYSLPTIQGIPLKMKLDGTTVVGLKKEGRLESSSPSPMNIIPSISTEVTGFIGFTSFINSCGVRTKNIVGSNSGVSVNIKRGKGYELLWNIPTKMKVVDFMSETYLMKTTNRHIEIKIHAEGVRESRVQHQSCLAGLQENTGLKVCYDIALPDILRSKGLPLGPPTTLKLTVEKSEPSMTGVMMKGEIQRTPTMTEIKLRLETPGSPIPRKAETNLIYSLERDTHKMSAEMSSQSFGGLKMEVKTKYSDSEKELEFLVHRSQSKQFVPDSQVVEARMSSRYNDQDYQVEMLFQTKNALKNYVDHHMEVRGYVDYIPTTALPFPRRLDKLYVRTVAGDYKWIASIQKTSDSQYTSVFKLGSRETDRLSLEAEHNLEGNWQDGFTMKTLITSKVGNSSHKIIFDVLNTQNKIGSLFQVIRLQDTSKVIELGAIYTKTEQLDNAKVELNLPEYMDPIKFACFVEKPRSNHYRVQAALKHGSQMILNVDGPVIVKFIPEMRHLHTDLTFDILSSRPHRISSVLLFAQNKQVLSFELRDQEETIVALDWNISAESEAQTKSAFRLYVPTLMDNRIDASIDNQHIHLSFHNTVSPKSSSPRRVIGFTDIDFENHNMKAVLYWDANRDKNKNSTFEATVVSRLSSSYKTEVHGSWSYIGQSYRYQTELVQSDPYFWLYGKKDVKITLTTPSQKTHNLQTISFVQKQSSSVRVASQIMYKTPEHRNYEVRSDVTVENLGEPHNFKLTSNNVVISSGQMLATGYLDIQHESSFTQRHIGVQVHIERPTQKKSIGTSFNLVHKSGSYKAEWNIDKESSVKGAMYDLEFSPEGAIHKCLILLNINEISSLLMSMKNINGMKSDRDGNPPRPEHVYILHYKRPTSTFHKILIQSPSRKMEGQLNYSTSEYSIVVYPNRHLSDAQYEMSLIRSKTSSPWVEELKYVGSFDHPSLIKRKTVELLYSKNGEKIQGTFTLDVFAETENKITGTLESTKIARNSLKIKAVLSGKALKIRPVIEMTVLLDPLKAGIDFLVDIDPSLRPPLYVSGKYDHMSGGSGALALTIETTEGTVLELSGSLEPDQLNDCNGLKMSAVARESSMDTYDILLNLCKPGFGKLLTKRHGSLKSYITIIGMQGTQNIEASILERDETSSDQTHIALIGVKLASPTMITTEMKFEQQRASDMLEIIMGKWSKVASLVSTWMGKMHRDIIQESASNTPSTEIGRLWQETKEEARRVYGDLVKVIPSHETFKHWTMKQLIHDIVTGYRQLWSQVDGVIKSLNHIIPDALKSFKSTFKNLTQTVNRVVVGSARWMKTGKMPEELKYLIQEVESNVLVTDVKRFFWHVQQMLVEDRRAIRVIFVKYKETLLRDLEKIREDLMQHSKFEKSVNRLLHQDYEHLLTKKVGHAFDKLIQQSLLSSTQIMENGIEIQIPLRQKVSSLTEALKYFSPTLIPVPGNILQLYEALTLQSTDYLVWSYYTLLPYNFSHLLPPYNGTAMVVDGTEIMTFDGAILQVPHSPCRVLLTTYKTHTLTMEHPQSSPISPRTTLVVEGVSVIVNPDYKVSVNGKEFSGQKMTEGKFEVIRTKNEIKVTSPYIILRVYPEHKVMTIEVSGWTYGQVVGLLGTYDGERGNDWATSRGTQTSSLQELTRSWQENQECQTPNITPVSLSQVPPMKYLQCQALLGVRSRCNPLVQPEPFMKMCHTSRSACDVAKAYQAVCSSKGVKEMLPFTC